KVKNRLAFVARAIFPPLRVRVQVGPPFDTVQRTHVEGLRLPMMGVTKVGGDCDGLKLKGNTLGAILGTFRLTYRSNTKFINILREICDCSMTNTTATDIFQDPMWRRLRPGPYTSIVEVTRFQFQRFTVSIKELAEWFGLEVARIVVDECLVTRGK